MKFEKTKLTDLLLIKPDVHEDSRGYFLESYNQRVFQQNGISESFNQDNISFSRKGTIRGLHYQLNPHSQSKLVRAIVGSIFDVAVDLRRNSPTFGKWFGTTLSAENKLSVYIPAGYAHGFYVLSDEAVFSYKCSTLYRHSSERTLLWSDSHINIKWPETPNLDFMSEKDKKAPHLKDTEINFVYKE